MWDQSYEYVGWMLKTGHMPAPGFTGNEQPMPDGSYSYQPVSGDGGPDV